MIEGKSRPMKVYKNILWNLSLQIVTLGLPLLTIPYISRILGPTGVGINAYTSSIAQYFVLIAGLGVALYGTKQIAEVRDDREELSSEFWKLVILKLVLGIPITIIYFMITYKNIEYRFFYVGQSLTLFATIIDITWFFQGIEQFRTTVLRNVLMRLISTICIFLLVKTSNDTLIYIVISSGSTLFANLVLWIGIYHHVLFKFKFKVTEIYEDLKGSVALFIPQVATQIYYPISKMLIGIFIGVQASGYFENSDKIVKVIVGIITSISTVFLPHVTHFFSNGQKEKVKESFYHSFHLIFFLGLGLSNLIFNNASQFSIWFFGNKFAGVGKLMQVESIVILLIAISNTIGYQFLIPTGKIRRYNFGVIIGSLLNIILDIPFIIFFGVIGAMIATVFSEFVVVIIFIKMLYPTFEYKLLFEECFKYVIAFTGSTIISKISITFIHNSSIFLTLLANVVISGLGYVLLLIIMKPRVLKKAFKYLIKL